MRVGKLNPTTKAWSGGTIPIARISYPGFQEIADFTSAGSEAAFSVPVDGDTDKEYFISARNTDTSDNLILRLNSDSGNNYGWQYIDNTTGSITSSRFAAAVMFQLLSLSFGTLNLLTPTGFTKTGFTQYFKYTTGTTIDPVNFAGMVWNNTANVTLLTFSMSSGNFTAGTRITVFARRSR